MAAAARRSGTSSPLASAFKRGSSSASSRAMAAARARASAARRFRARVAEYLVLGLAAAFGADRRRRRLRYGPRFSCRRRLRASRGRRDTDEPSERKRTNPEKWFIFHLAHPQTKNNVADVTAF